MRTQDENTRTPRGRPQEPVWGGGERLLYKKKLGRAIFPPRTPCGHDLPRPRSLGRAAWPLSLSLCPYIHAVYLSAAGSKVSDTLAAVGICLL